MNLQWTAVAALIALTALGGGCCPARRRRIFPISRSASSSGWPGGGTDVTARLIAQRLSASLATNVYVENKPAAPSSRPIASWSTPHLTATRCF